MENKKNGNTMVIVIVVLISIVLVVGITMMLLKEDANINQGRFRINDIAIKSTVDAEDKTTDLNNWQLNLSQRNHLSILIDKESNSIVSKIYVDDIQLEVPQNVGNFYISPKNDNLKYVLTDQEKDQFDIFVKEQDGCYLAEIDVNNDEFLKDYKVENTVKELRYDGTLLTKVGVSVDKLKFKISFNLNIIDIQGNLNTARIIVEAPDKELQTVGTVVKKLDVKDFGFKLIE